MSVFRYTEASGDLYVYLSLFPWRRTSVSVYVSQSGKKLINFLVTWAVARQAPVSVVFPRQEYWSGLPFPSPGDLSDPGMGPTSPALQADSLLSEPPGKGSPAPTFF